MQEYLTKTERIQSYIKEVLADEKKHSTREITEYVDSKLKENGEFVFQINSYVNAAMRILMKNEDYAKVAYGMYQKGGIPYTPAPKATEPESNLDKMDVRSVMVEIKSYANKFDKLFAQKPPFPDMEVNEEATHWAIKKHSLDVAKSLRENADKLFQMADSQYQNERNQIIRKYFVECLSDGNPHKMNEIKDYIFSKMQENNEYSGERSSAYIYYPLVKKLLRDSIQNWLEVFKFPSVEPTTYDRCECTAKNQVYPMLGDKAVGDVVAADIKNLLNHLMNKGLAFSTVKKAYVLLNEYFKTMYLEEMISKNPMDNVEMIKKANFLSAQGKECLPECETITIFIKEEVEKFKAEISNSKYTQASAYILMLNTGTRTGEMLGVLNSDIDLENKTMRIRQAVKTVEKRDETKSLSKKDIKVGKTKSATSMRVIPLNKTAIEMIIKLREERYFGENTPLICDENGGYTKPYTFRNRYYTILKNAGIETKGMHALRHTFASNLVNGIKQADGSIKALSPKQVADILGHTTSQITEMYYVKRDSSRLNGVTDGFEI